MGKSTPAELASGCRYKEYLYTEGSKTRITNTRAIVLIKGL